MAIKTSTELVQAAINVANNFKSKYVWGAFGRPVTAASISTMVAQYPTYNTKRQAGLTAVIGKGYFMFDCIGLIKGLLWGWSGNASATYGGATYASNGVPDVDADTMINRCSGASTDFSNIVAGEVVWKVGHIGIYIGDGKVVEATPSWSDGVQITACHNKGTISGLNGQSWTKHGKMPYISYDTTISSGTSSGTTATVSNDLNLSIGDIVDFTGNMHYSSSSAAAGVSCKPGKAKVTAILNTAKHPYHLQKVAGGTSTVFGWVDAADISSGFAVGDKVKVVAGAKTYTGGALASYVYSTVYTILQISGNRAVISIGTAITAAIHTDNLIKQ